MPEDPANFTRPCSMNGLGRYKCPTGSYCGNPYDYPWLDLESENFTSNPKIFYGVSTFNNIFTTLITINQFTSTDDWSSFMYNMMDIDHPAFAVMYSLINIIIGNFFIMNLILAVVFDTFTNLEDIERRKQELKQTELIMNDSQLNSEDSEQETPVAEGFGNVAKVVMKDQLFRAVAQQELKLLEEELTKTREQPNEAPMELIQKESGMLKGSIIDQNEVPLSAMTPSGMRKANTYVEMDTHLPMLFPPMHVIPEEPVFHIDEGTEQDSILSPDEQRFNSLGNNANFGFLKAQTQDLPNISHAITPQGGLLQSIMQNNHQDNDNMPKKSSKPSTDNEKNDQNPKEVLISEESFDIESPSAAQNSNIDNAPASSEDEELNDRQNIESSQDQPYSSRDSEGSSDSDYDDEQDYGDENETYDQNAINSEDSFDKSNQNINHTFTSQTRSMKSSQGPKPPSQQHNSQEEDIAQEFRNPDVLSTEEAQKQEDLKQGRMFIEMIEQEENDERKSELENIRDRYYHSKRAEKNWLYHYSYAIVHSEYFVILIQFSIIVNTALQSLDQYPTPTYIQDVDNVNIFFSILFIIEMFLKLFGLGFKYYFKDPFNRFDCFIAVTSLIDLALADSVGAINVDTITVLRTFRLMRVFKLARTWKEFHQLISTMGKTLEDISSFTVVLFLFMFIYSILGMELFAYKAKFLDDETPDLINGESLNQNFDSFLWSFTTVFVLLTEDAWSYIYQKYYVAVSGWRSNMYFLSLYILGPKILLNIFLAVLLQNFEDDSIELEELQAKNEEEVSSENIVQSSENESYLWIKNQLINIRPVIQKYFKNCFKTRKVKPQKDDDPLLADKQSVRLTMDFGGNYKQQLENLFTEKKLLTRTIAKSQTITESNYITDIDLTGKSLNIFDEENKLRVALFKLVNGRNLYFERVIIFFILVSQVQLALANSLNDPNGILFVCLYWIDVITTIVFLIECIFKIIAFGMVINGEASYLRNPWNMIDFIIIIISVVAISPLANQLQAFKMFRILRAVRLISRAEGLRIGLQALVQAVPNVLRIVLMMVLFFLIFGIIAISYFKGRFFNCVYNDNLMSTIPNYQTDFSLDRLDDEDFLFSKWDCLNSGAEWVRNYYNFDNMYQTMASLFILANIAGWQDFMYIGVKVTDIDYAWKKGSHSYWVFFFIGFIIFGSFFLLNLFVGVVISSFNRQKEHLGGLGYLREKQKQDWAQIHLMVLKSEPIPRPHPAETNFGKLCQKLYKWNHFETFIYGSIIFNTFLLTIKWQGMSTGFRSALEAFNIIFTAIFLFEVIIKITATGTQYFVDNWNIFDFFVTVLSILTIVLDKFGMVAVGSSMMVVRAFRISKILRLIKKSKSLRHIFKTFIHCLKPLANIGSLLLLILYMYTIAGVILFGEVKRNGKLTDTLNFESFAAGALALFVVSTTDAWTDITISCLKRESVDFQCINNPTYQDFLDNDGQTVGCGPKFSGILYFYSYFLIMSLILLKLFVAIILQAYDEIKSYERRSFNDDSIEQFNKIWQEYYSGDSVFIKINDMPRFMTELCNASYFKGMLFWDPDDKKAQLQYLKDMNLHIYKNFSSYLYYEVLDAIAQRLTVMDYVLRGETDKDKEGAQQSEANISPMTQKEDLEFTEQETQQLQKAAFNQEFEIFVKQVNSLLTSLIASEILVLKEIQAYRESLTNKWRLKQTQEYIYDNNVKDYRNRKGRREVTSESKIISYVSSKNVNKLIEFFEIMRRYKRPDPNALRIRRKKQEEIRITDESSQKGMYSVRSGASQEMEVERSQTVSIEDEGDRGEEGSMERSVNYSMLSNQPLKLNPGRIVQIIESSLKTKLEEIQNNLIQTMHKVSQSSSPNQRGISSPSSPLTKLFANTFEKQQQQQYQLHSKSKSPTKPADETPLRLTLNPCEVIIPPPLHLEDKDSMHHLYFKAYNKTKEQLKQASFAMPDSYQVRKPRLRSALARTSHNVSIGLGGSTDEEELMGNSLQRRRPQSAAYRKTQQFFTQSPQRINQNEEMAGTTNERQVNSMLQNYMKEDATTPLKLAAMRNPPETVAKSIMMSNQKREISATFSISKKSPTEFCGRLSSVKKQIQ